MNFTASMFIDTTYYKEVDYFDSDNFYNQDNFYFILPEQIFPIIPYTTYIYT